MDPRMQWLVHEVHDDSRRQHLASLLEMQKQDILVAVIHLALLPETFDAVPTARFSETSIAMGPELPRGWLTARCSRTSKER